MHRWRVLVLESTQQLTVKVDPATMQATIDTVGTHIEQLIAC